MGPPSRAATSAPTSSATPPTCPSAASAARTAGPACSSAPRPAGSPSSGSAAAWSCATWTGWRRCTSWTPLTGGSPPAASSAPSIPRRRCSSTSPSTSSATPAPSGARGCATRERGVRPDPAPGAGRAAPAPPGPGRAGPPAGGGGGRRRRLRRRPPVGALGSGAGRRRHGPGPLRRHRRRLPPGAVAVGHGRAHLGPERRRPPRPGPAPPPGRAAGSPVADRAVPVAGGRVGDAPSRAAVVVGGRGPGRRRQPQPVGDVEQPPADQHPLGRRGHPGQLVGPVELVLPDRGDAVPGPGRCRRRPAPPVAERPPGAPGPPHAVGGQVLLEAALGGVADGDLVAPEQQGRLLGREQLGDEYGQLLAQLV